MPPIVDVHTHIYPPSYISLLRSRNPVPYILDLPAPLPPRLVILPSDDDPFIAPFSRGRPIGPEYSSITEKLNFMSLHKITTSVISLANPWLDFLPADEALSAATRINEDFEEICANVQGGEGKLYAFGTLPVSASPHDVISEIRRLDKLPHIRGVILGTSGRGEGLDDPALDPIWDALAETQLLTFLHPHYGLPNEVFGPRAKDYGHVLPLSLGFPMETTIAFVRMWLSGVFDRHEKLQILIAHGGGTVPFLAGRVESCVEHDRKFRDEQGNQIQVTKRSILQVLRANVWLDAVVYSDIGLEAAQQAVGPERVLFGTDHPFFPPLDKESREQWTSVTSNIQAVETFASGWNACEAMLGGNAIELLNLEIPQ